MKPFLPLTLLALLAASVLGTPSSRSASVPSAPVVGIITEFPLAWPSLPVSAGSTHELTWNRALPAGAEPVFWVTGQTHDAVARVTLAGDATFFPMPAGSRPHGIVFDAAGNLWVTLEYAGQLARIDQTTGAIIQTIDVSLHATGAPSPVNTHPHGLGVAPDGTTLWFTGKATGTVGRVTFAADGTATVAHFALPTTGSVPIYIIAGPDGNMWCTELVGNAIARVTPEGTVTEYSIPTYNSRPIGITPGPDGHSLWFSEEAGNKVGRIVLDPVTYAFVALAEYPVPMLHANTILAALAFDSAGNLWTQAYVNPNSPYPAGTDAIVRLDASLTLAPYTAAVGAISDVPVTFYEVPTADTVMHRITHGPDGAIWFTELAADQLGRLELVPATEAAARPRPLLKKAPAADAPRKIRPQPQICG
jgi:virginiamycin B lyase